MTLATQMLSDVSDVLLNIEEHAGTYRLTPYGTGITRDVVGVWDVMESTRDDSSGRRTVHKAKLLTASDAVIRIDDQLSVNSETWSCSAVGATEVGMKCWHFTRLDVHNQATNAARVK